MTYLVGIGPEKVAEESGVGDIGGAHNLADLLHVAEVGRETTVHAEDFLVDERRNGQAVEAVSESLPQLDVVASLALVVEAVDAVDGRALVVSAQHKEVLGVLDLVCKQQTNGLQRLFATVNVISQEKVVAIRRESSVLEKENKTVSMRAKDTIHKHTNTHTQTHTHIHTHKDIIIPYACIHIFRATIPQRDEEGQSTVRAHHRKS